MLLNDLLLIWFLVLPRFDPSLFKAGAAARRVGAIIVDAENLRGKAGFALSHYEMLELVTAWTDLCELKGKVTLVVDHGSEQNAFWLADRGLSVVFSGRSQKADDVIANDVSFLGKEDGVMVVTADQGLIYRCERSIANSSLRILSPALLLQDLDMITRGSLVQHPKYASATSPPPTKLDYSTKLAGALLETEALIRNRISVKNKRRKKLKRKAQMLREKLSNCESSMLDLVTDVLANGRSSDRLKNLSHEEQAALLARWEKAGRTVKRKERTGDRISLAENLQASLKEEYEQAIFNSTSGRMSPSPARDYTTNINSRRSDIDLSSDTVRIVVISDTHGFEEQLTPNGTVLPDGDVILHLGDFAVDGAGKAEALHRFDSWLSEQPHQAKIVLRGNHDPKVWQPSISGARYVTRPTTLSIGKLSFIMVPYLSGGVSIRCIPRKCDVLVSHVPPRGILDSCSTGKNAGSKTIRRCAERMKAGPPMLWMCGHIHEARGVAHNAFCLDKETLVVNCANANSGIAANIEHGPVVLELERSSRGKRVDLIEMSGRYTCLNQKAYSFFKHRAQDGSGEMLMAVDLGLRTGVSLYNNLGKLVRYQNFEFSAIDELEEASRLLVKQWEVDANSSKRRWSLTRIALEGGDPPLREAWRKAANGQQTLLNVKPDDWRSDLLTREERKSGESAKDASKKIALQIVADHGGRLHQGKMKTDVAESILIGLHVARRLGWINREPSIRRHRNGSVVVPE